MELEGHMSSYDHHHRKVGGALNLLVSLANRSSLLSSRSSSACPLLSMFPAREVGAELRTLPPLRLQRLLELKADENQRTKASRDRKDRKQASKEAARLEAQ